MTPVDLRAGDCREILPEIEAGSVDAIVTDPPYGIGFLGKDWDRFTEGLPGSEAWRARRRERSTTVEKLGGNDGAPGARFPTNVYGGRSVFKRCGICGRRQFSGTPCKCPEPDWHEETPVGAPTDAVVFQRWCEEWATEALRVLRPGGYMLAFGGTRTYHRLAVAVEDVGFAIQDTLAWLYGQGFPKHRGLLKPGFEPVVVARKGGSPAIRVEDSRLSGGKSVPNGKASALLARAVYGGGWKGQRAADSGGLDPSLGRWPANVALDEETARILDEQSGDRPGATSNGISQRPGYADSGGASRFFFVSKASSGERGVGLGTDHPTVKPLRLMRWLVRLVSDPGDLILDPFLGSGTTGAAAVIEGRRFLGIEQDEETLDSARGRIGDLVYTYAPRS